jgi:chromate transporter
MMELLELYLIFLRIGFFTIGGGMAMLPLMQRELVANELMTMAETIDMVAISQMTPGPFAINASTFAGMRLHGLQGAAAATLGVVTPSIVLTVIVAKFFLAYSKREGVRDTMATIRPVVTGLILSAALLIAWEALLNGGTEADVPAIVVAAAALGLLLTVKKLSPILLITVCGVFGAIFLQY